MFVWVIISPYHTIPYPTPITKARMTLKGAPDGKPNPCLPEAEIRKTVPHPPNKLPADLLRRAAPTPCQSFISQYCKPINVLPSLISSFANA